LDNPFSVLLLHPVITRNIRKTHKSSNLSGLRMVTKLLIRLPRIIYHTNNYLFDEKKENFFSPFFSSSARVIKRMFLTREQKKKVEKRISFFIGHEVLFYETTFSASAECKSGYDRGGGLGPTDREADYRCLSPLRRKTSELEREEEYTSIFRALQARSRN
jgi:hypothetical protein